MAGLYIHIPFCASRCVYCGFYSTTLPQLQQRYVDALCGEMHLRRNEMDARPTTVYLGGGTPSQLHLPLLDRLFDGIDRSFGLPGAEAEVTMECNPDDVTDEFTAWLAHAPVNRVSMGVQTFDDGRLRFLHRRHTAHQAREAVDRLRRVGIGNISIDLMFGFPGQTLDAWQEDIRQALSLGVEHLSAYSLMYEEGTRLYDMLQRGDIREIDDELSLRMYDLLTDSLTAAGYEHYEISNFALPHCRSRHNSSYWHSVPYVGIGAAAHSFDLTSRSWNVSDIRAYIDAIERGVLPSEREQIDDDTRYDDIITTALRTREGICLDDLLPRHRRYLLQTAQHHLEDGTLQCHDNRISLTRKGIYISDSIMADLMYV